MSFQCQSCGHKGRQAKQGACPACSSFNLKRIRADEDKDDTKKRSKLKSFILAVLWLYLAFVVVQELFLK